MVKRDKQNTLKKDKRPRARNKKKMIIFVVGGALVVAAIVYGLWLYLQGSTGQSQVAERPLTRQETLRNDLIDAVATSGDQAKSDAALNEAADAAANDEQRAELYLDRAAYLYYNDDISDEIKNQALSDAEKSYQLHETGAAVKTILDIATSLDRQDLIAKYQPIFDTYVKDIKDLREGGGQ